MCASLREFDKPSLITSGRQIILASYWKRGLSLSRLSTSSCLYYIPSQWVLLVMIWWTAAKLLKRENILCCITSSRIYLCEMKHWKRKKNNDGNNNNNNNSNNSRKIYLNSILSNRWSESFFFKKVGCHHEHSRQLAERSFLFPSKDVYIFNLNLTHLLFFSFK